MKGKNIIITVLVIILIGAAGAVAYLALGSKEEVTTTAQSSTEITSQDSSTSAPTETTTQTTTQTTTKTTTETTTEPYPFIRSGAWYLADTENETCIAIAFSKNGKADIAYFNSDNIEGLDAQYFKGDGSFDIRKDKIIFSKLPEATGMVDREFEIKGKDIYYKGKKLRHFDKINLDNALKCFE